MLRKLLLASFLFSGFAHADIQVGKAIDYSKLAFYPKRWETKGIDTQLYPWSGKNIAFLTISEDFDSKVMTEFIGTLDQGWDTYLDFTGKAPAASRHVGGKAPIAAIPGGGLTCGFGCGFVGHHGIEANGFYTSTYDSIKKNPKAVPHLYFYEMGRNFFTFGNRHDSFTTGFAVFMRYVCIDKLEVVDGDQRTRKVINEAVDEFAKSDLPFLKNFTNAYGFTEKNNRLKHGPTDQPVMYASAMLKLWKLHGDDWTKSFFRHIHTAPKANKMTKEGARQHSLTWYLAASLAAKKDLAPIFVEQWRFPITEKEKSVLKDLNWADEKLTLPQIITKLAS